jgi:glycosyltransferase involved in cell wall biosynthesis
MSACGPVGYIPYVAAPESAEAGWLAEHLSLDVRVAHEAPPLNDRTLPPLERLRPAIRDLLPLPAVVAEGPGGFLWAALLRAHGYAGSVTVLPYLNPRRWLDVAAVALYRRFSRPDDRAFVGSAPSASVYAALGAAAWVGEPFGVDDRLFGLRPGAERTRRAMGVPAGRLLVYAGRAQPDKDVHRLVRVGLKARVLFSDLQVVIASHVADEAYLAPAREHIHFLADPGRDELADLYNAADVFVTASTSHFETFGRAPAEALACGCRAIAPRYDGFAEVLDQPGGTLVDVELDAAGEPEARDELLLRAVFDVLSARERPARGEISAAARRRFGRSRTIGLLAHLAGRRPRPAPAASPAAVSLPEAWRPPLGELARRAPAEAVSWFWEGCDHGRLGAHDGELIAAVRRALCVPASVAAGEAVGACR